MKYTTVLVAALMLSIITCYSQWTQTDGPYGNTNVRAIIPSDSLILVSTDCGYFSKQTILDSWTLNSISSFLGFTRIGDSLFVGGSDLRLISLSNPNNPPIIISSIPLSVLSHSDSCLYGGSSLTGFFKSNDFGITWSSVKNGLPVDSFWNPWTAGYYYEWNVTSIDLAANYIFCGTNRGVYRNSANLSNWVPVNSGLLDSMVTLIKSFNDTLYTAIDKNLYTSRDFGNSWSLLFTSPSKITSFCKTSNDFYLGTNNNGIYESTDGISWNAQNAGLPEMQVTTISYFDSTLVCGTYSKGIFYYQGGQWISNKSGMICSYIRTISCTDSLVFSNDDDFVYMLNNRNLWTDITPNFTNDLFINLDKMGDTIFISNYYVQSNWPYFYQSIFFSTDYGALWNQITHLPYTSAGGNTWHKIYIRNGRIYAYSDEKMYFTDDLGLNWSNISLPSQYCNGFNDFLIFNSNHFAAACGNGQVVKLDSIQQWVLSNNGIPGGREPLSLAYCNSVLFVYLYGDGMYVSFNDGNNWFPANIGLVSNSNIRDFVNYGSHLFVTSDYGVFVTSNYGQNWYPINNGLRNLNASSIKILNDTLYVGTYGNGVWKQAIVDIGLGIQEQDQIKKLIQIFPNPFSAQTTLYTGDYFEHATLTISNSLGQIVKQIIDISGNEISFSRDNLSEGLYIVHLTETNKIYTGKIIVSD
ncbi:MAG TPA: T9SS type A sorting domain-containing protein [Bacteroidia bacterium]|nr:T9SS type A sorting domain-containing protein [Bacteroidia bacterium]